MVSIQVKYENQGQASVSGMIKLSVPENTTFNASASTGVQAAGGGTWSCADGSAAGTVCELAVNDLAAGASGEATFAVTVNNELMPDAGALDFTAQVEADGISGETSETLAVDIAAPTGIAPVQEPELELGSSTLHTAVAIR